MNKIVIPPQYLALASDYPNLTPCRVSCEENGSYTVISGSDEIPAVLANDFFNESTAFPVIGDYVVADIQNGNAVIYNILYRKSTFTRKSSAHNSKETIIASNIDTVFICLPLDDTFDPRKVEKYISSSWDCGASPVLVLTKADLCSDVDKKLAGIERFIVGVDILVTTAVSDDGYDKLLPYLKPGKTIAFAGSSGSGKTTLISRLSGCETTADPENQKNNSEHKKLITLSEGAMIIDTPEMRGLGLWETEESGEMTFYDIEDLISKCRFRNCTHTNEPGCMIRKAIENGTLTEERLNAFNKILTDNSNLEDPDGFLTVKDKRSKNALKSSRFQRTFSE